MSELAANVAMKLGWRKNYSRTDENGMVFQYADPELDGWTWAIPNPYDPNNKTFRGHDSENGDPPPYDKDLNLAWECVDAMREAGWVLILRDRPANFDYIPTEDASKKVRAFVSIYYLPSIPADRKGKHAWGDCAAQAICRVFLAWRSDEASDNPHGGKA